MAAQRGAEPHAAERLSGVGAAGGGEELRVLGFGVGGKGDV